MEIFSNASLTRPRHGMEGSLSALSRPTASLLGSHGPAVKPVKARLRAGQMLSFVTLNNRSLSPVKLNNLLQFSVNLRNASHLVTLGAARLFPDNTAGPYRPLKILAFMIAPLHLAQKSRPNRDGVKAIMWWRGDSKGKARHLPG